MTDGSPLAISDHTESISIIESVIPNEILELIFLFFGPVNLHILCVVCHRWRSLALSLHRLWAQSLPRIIEFHQSRSKDPLRAHRQDRIRAKFYARVQQCLQRSGTEPISFSFKCAFSLEIESPIRGWPISEKDALYSVLSPLVDECSRWRHVEFYTLPMDVFQDLLERKLKGRALEELRTLKLSLWPSVTAPADRDVTESHLPPTTPISFHCFSSAPSLRAFDLHLRLMFKYGHIERGRPINIDLAWRQLESFKYASYRDDGAYFALLQAHEELKTSSRLQVVDLFVTRILAVPMFPFTSVTLHTLHLRLGLNSALFCSHIDKLTLPALENLEIRGPFDGTVLTVPQSQHHATLYTTVARLIARSGCSLEKLALDMGWSPVENNGDQQWAGLSRILDLTPRLHELDIAISPGQKSRRTLRGLDADQEGDAEYLDGPLLPHLEILTFRLVTLPTPDPLSEQMDEADWDRDDAWASTDLAHIFDLASLEHLIRSRMELTSSAECGPPLVEVRIVLPSDVAYPTGPLLQRLRSACSFKFDSPVSDSAGTTKYQYYWKGLNLRHDDEVLVLRRRWIPHGVSQEMQAVGDGTEEDDDDDIGMVSIKTFPPFWTWDIDDI